MKETVCLMFKVTHKSKIFLSFLVLSFLFFSILGILYKQETLIAGTGIWALILFGAWVFRPEGKIHTIRIGQTNFLSSVFICLLSVALILVCVLPMSLSPHWNGTYPSEVTEYEEMTQAILKGQIWLDLEVDPRLVAMENPYDVNARRSIEGLVAFWDHAFYNGRYYMYFGIVPVFLVFLPMYFLTGTIILSYQATQIIAVFTIFGLFMLYAELARTFFPRLRVSLYACLCVISTAVILWYASGAPALYCTATLSGVCLMIWSLFFFINAIYVQKTENRQILMATLGSVCGALVVGCRPPIAIANLCVLPLLFVYLSSRKITLRLVGKLIMAAFPYVIIIGLLLIYNKARFDSYFEFGQSYQLTLADQRNYASFWTVFSWSKFLKDLKNTFFQISPLKDTFPYIAYSGLFVCYPFLLLIFSIFSRPVRKSIAHTHLSGFTIALFIVPFLIIMIDGLWSPFLLERYKLDFSFVMCILLLLSCGFIHEHLSENNGTWFAFIMYISAIQSVFVSLLLFLIPMDYNYTFYYGDRILDLFDSMLFFWRYL